MRAVRTRIIGGIDLPLLDVCEEVIDTVLVVRALRAAAGRPGLRAIDRENFPGGQLGLKMVRVASHRGGLRARVSHRGLLDLGRRRGEKTVLS